MDAEQEPRRPPGRRRPVDHGAGGRQGGDPGGRRRAAHGEHGGGGAAGAAAAVSRAAGAAASLPPEPLRARIRLPTATARATGDRAARASAGRAAGGRGCGALVLLLIAGGGRRVPADPAGQGVGAPVGSSSSTRPDGAPERRLQVGRDQRASKQPSGIVIGQDPRAAQGRPRLDGHADRLLGPGQRDRAGVAGRPARTGREGDPSGRSEGRHVRTQTSDRSPPAR